MEKVDGEKQAELLDRYSLSIVKFIQNLVYPCYHPASSQSISIIILYQVSG